MRTINVMYAKPLLKITQGYKYLLYQSYTQCYKVIQVEALGIEILGLLRNSHYSVTVMANGVSTFQKRGTLHPFRRDLHVGMARQPGPEGRDPFAAGIAGLFIYVEKFKVDVMSRNE